MAKKRRAVAVATRAAPTQIVVTQPRRAVSRRRQTVAVARRVGRRAAGAARANALPIGVLLGAAGIGWAQAKGYLNKIPTIGGSRATTLAIAGFALTRLTSNKTARQLGSTAMIIGAFDFGSKQGGGKSALEGDDDMSGGEFGDDDI